MMMKRRDFCLAASAALLLSRQPVFAEDALFTPKIYRNSKNETLPYRWFVPRGYDKREKYPLVLWLHGGAGRGNDNLKQISGGNTIGSHVWTSPEHQARHPTFVVAPQCPEDEMWATLEKAQPTRYLGLVLGLLQELQKTFSLDRARYYVAGQSLGGFGTWSIIQQHPGMFAAAVPVCGGGNESDASKLIKTPIWAFHGEKDNAVPVERSRRMIDAIKRAGGSPKYTEYSNRGHNVWETVFSEPELLPWVFSQQA